MLKVNNFCIYNKAKNISQSINFKFKYLEMAEMAFDSAIAAIDNVNEE